MNHTAVASKGLDIKAESLKIALGVLALFASSQIAIPLQPVPITLQTVAVMLIGMLYSRRSGMAATILFTILGGMGLPVFKGFQGGFQHIYGPTGGYIIGFTVSVYVMSLLREKFRLETFWGIFTTCVIGTAVVFVCGVSWLATSIGYKSAISLGLLPFIIPGAVKAILLSGALRFIRGGK